MIYGLHVAGLRFGDSVVIQGAGGLGIQAAAVAKDMGAATVIVVDQIPGRLELARAFGADHTINLKDVPDRRERVKLVREWTGGVGADVACDFVGFPAVIPEGIEMLRAGGTYLEIGTISRGRQDRARAVAPRLGLEEDRRRDPVRSVGDPPRARLPRPHPRPLAVDRLLSHTYPLEQINEAFAASRVAQPGDDHDHPRGARALER